jgi:hypothetical protein
MALRPFVSPGDRNPDGEAFIVAVLKQGIGDLYGLAASPGIHVAHGRREVLFSPGHRSASFVWNHCRPCCAVFFDPDHAMTLP